MMNIVRESVKNAYMSLINEDPVPLKDETPAVPANASAPTTTPVEQPTPEPAVEEPISEPATVPEKTKDIQSKVISILSSKLMGDVKDKIYEMKFLLKKSTDPKVFELIAAINSDIKDINAQILNTFNR
jgi:hypothetical protein